jgi:hypothetical protein
VHAPGLSFGSFSHWPVAGLIAVIAVALVQLGRKRSGTARAALTGTAAGLFLGIADAFTRVSVLEIDGHHPFGVLTHWPSYATVLASIIGLWLMQNAFNAAPLHASLPAVTAAEPAAGIALGVVVFGDVVHITPFLLALQAAGIAAMVGGVILVARAPIFSDLHVAQLPQAALERLQQTAALLPRLDGSSAPAPDPAAPDPGERPGGSGDGASDQPGQLHDEASAGSAGDPADVHRELGGLVAGGPPGISQAPTAVTMTDASAVTGSGAVLKSPDGRQ